MDIQDYIRKVKNLKNDLPSQLANEIYPEVIEATLNSFKRRVFTNGLDSEKQIIGTYSETPTNASKKAFVKKSAFSSNTKGGKSMKLSNGYKELKQIQGLKSDKVNLVYTGDLRESVQSQKKGTGYSIGFTDINNSRKAKQLEKKYGKAIFRLSEEEKTTMNKRLATALRKLHKSYFYAK